MHNIRVGLFLIVTNDCQVIDACQLEQKIMGPASNVVLGVIPAPTSTELLACACHIIFQHGTLHWNTITSCRDEAMNAMVYDVVKDVACLMASHLPHLWLSVGTMVFEWNHMTNFVHLQGTSLPRSCSRATVLTWCWNSCSATTRPQPHAASCYPRMQTQQTKPKHSL